MDTQVVTIQDMDTQVDITQDMDTQGDTIQVVLLPDTDP